MGKYSDGLAFKLIALFAICIAIGGILYINTNANAIDSRGNSSITVTGTGLLKADPDKARICLGVETQSDNVTAALEENSLKMRSVIKAIKDIGISGEDIETTYFGVYPIRDYEKRNNEIVGYRVSSEVQVEVRDLEKTGRVIEEAMRAGANKVRSIEFGLTDAKRDKLRNEAIEKACKNARAKADAIARGLGLRIVRIRTAKESGVYVRPYRSSDLDYVVATATPEAVPPPIEPKSVDVSATIEVAYECI